MKKLLILPLFAFLVVSCSSSSSSPLAKRISENPQLHAALNSRQKALIEEGKIENGMTTGAVFLAWGDPAKRAEGQEDNQHFEKWTYTGLAPIYHHSFSGGYGGGFGGRGFGGRGFGGRGFGGHGFGGHGYSPYGSFGTGVSYIPHRTAWVKFQKGRVSSWQRGQDE